MYCLVPEKQLRLFIPLIFSGGIWSACGRLLSTPRVFPAGTIGDAFFESINIGFKIFFIESGNLWENGYYLSFNCMVRDELLNWKVFYSLKKEDLK